MAIGGKTRLVGLVGWPVAHSLSPAMHNAAAAALGIDWAYLPLPVRPVDLEAALHGLAALGFVGANVTIPHKQAVLAYLNEIDASAQAMGAANTILIERDGGRATFSGYNTDAEGFLADLAQQGVGVSGRACLVLGAGGSARAIVYGLARSGGHVRVLARSEAQAEQLAADLTPHLLGKQPPDGDAAFPVHAHSLRQLPQIAHQLSAPLIVNTTPVGMSPEIEGSVWPDRLPFPEGAFVYDLVYNPAETRLMRQASLAGCGVCNGVGMLVHQGALSFQLWTGQAPDVSVMAAAITG